MTGTDGLDLDAIRARSDAATPGPWERPAANVFRVVAPNADHHNKPQGLTPPYPWRIVCDTSDEDTAAADGEFIASARTDIPALLAEVDRLRSLVPTTDQEQK